MSAATKLPLASAIFRARGCNNKPLETPNRHLQVELPCATTGQVEKCRELPEGKRHPAKGSRTLAQEGPKITGQHHWLLSAAHFEFSDKMLGIPRGSGTAICKALAGCSSARLPPPPIATPSDRPWQVGF